MSSLRLFRASRQAIHAVSQRMRKRRMEAFRKVMGVRTGMRVLDLGGRPEIWQGVPETLEITFLNLPGETGAEVATHHRARFIEGDGCSVPELESKSFDVVFSNSVIEHVGGASRQAAFADEIRRLGRAYWVQTPSKWFPIEAHTGMPLWWFYPPELRAFFLERWRKSLPGWTESMEATRVLTVDQLRRLFPGAELWVESLAAFPKSYAVYRLER